MLGATGAIYALRQSLYTPVPKDVILDDMYVPLKVIEQGYRAIFDKAAKSLVKQTESKKTAGVIKAPLKPEAQAAKTKAATLAKDIVNVS